MVLDVFYVCVFRMLIGVFYHLALNFPYDGFIAPKRLILVCRLYTLMMCLDMHITTSELLEA